MDKSYFYVNTSDVQKTSEIFSAVKLELSVCSVYPESEKSLVSFKSSPDEQKAVMKKLMDSGISYTVIQAK